MIKHIETDVVGDTYRRAKTVLLNNPREGIKSIDFILEDLTNKSNGTYAKEEVGIVSLSFSEHELNKDINLINPFTDEIIGKKLLKDILNDSFFLLHSLMIHAENNYSQVKELGNE